MASALIALQDEVVKGLTEGTSTRKVADETRMKEKDASDRFPRAGNLERSWQATRATRIETNLMTETLAQILKECRELHDGAFTLDRECEAAIAKGNKITCVYNPKGSSAASPMIKLILFGVEKAWFPGCPDERPTSAPRSRSATTSTRPRPELTRSRSFIG